MAELRWNPLLRDWVMIASSRQDRPQMPNDWCPFCPGSGKVPENYEVYKYDNDFPVLSQEPQELGRKSTDLYKVGIAHGKCEVILYSPEHNKTLPQLSSAHINKLVDLWIERFVQLSRDEKIKYVFIFENKGEPVGVTMPHPHGQIYGYPFIPKRIQMELDSGKEHYEKHNSCIICDMLQEERLSGERIIFENDDFTAFIPFFTEYPYGIYIVSKKHISNISALNESERMNLARAIREAAGALDYLFGFSFPYMMCMYQNPVNGEDFSNFTHFHIKFFPPMRASNKIKYNASSETGAGAHCNPTSPEEKAAELRAAHEKFIAKEGV